MTLLGMLWLTRAGLEPSLVVSLGRAGRAMAACTVPNALCHKPCALLLRLGELRQPCLVKLSPPQWGGGSEKLQGGVVPDLT